MGHGHFTELQAILFGIAALLTFASHQIIPLALEFLSTRSRFPEAITSQMFTGFVRVCGVDHLTMAVFMSGGALGLVPEWLLPFAGWLVVVSAWVVSLISFLSALGIIQNGVRQA